MIIELEQDENGDLILPLGDELCSEFGWKVGDTIIWTDLGDGSWSMKKMEKELQELRSELQEINLLNAKLLYTNKIFRNKSLTESQKVKVLAAFDKAKNKQEAQLIYETLLGSVATTAKSPIKESLGSASKALGNATKPIIENDAFARMRELAGLTKK